MSRKPQTRQNNRKRPRTPTPPPSSSASSSSESGEDHERDSHVVSDSQSSSSDLTSPPPSKRPRTSRSRLEMNSTSKSRHESSSRSRSKSINHRASSGEDSGDDGDIGHYPSLGAGADKDVPLTKRNKKNKNSHKAVLKYQKKEKRQSILAQLAEMDDDLLQDILTSRARPVNAQKFDAALADGSNDTGEGENGGKETSEATKIIEGIISNQEETECEGEDKRKDLEEIADELSTALAAPFETFYTRCQDYNNTSFLAIGDHLQAALEPFTGQQTLQQLFTWRDDQVASAQRAAAEWDEAMIQIEQYGKKMEVAVRKIQAVNKEKSRLVAQARKDFEKILAQQETQMVKLKKELEKRKQKYRAQLVKATDKARINKEINMVMTKLLAQSNG